ncbi:MAG: DUF4870 domain-containing protein [Acidobacteriota bacterium]
MTEDEAAAAPPPPSPPAGPSAPLPPLSEQQERNIAMLMHLTGLLGYIAFAVGFVVPLVIWLTQKDRSAFVERQGYVMFNAWISYTIYSIPAIMLCFFCIGIPILLAIWALAFIATILVALAASRGETQEYPLVIRFLRAGQASSD